MIHELLEKRYSPRAFSDKKVEREKIQSLLEAAKWAPSSMNQQPWRFIVAEKDDKENFEKLLSTLNDKNKVWAQNAPVLILTMAKLDSDYNKKENRHALYDLGNSVAQLTFQATALNLYVRQMGGFSPEIARQLFFIPDNYLPVSVLAVGYLGSVEQLPEYLKKSGAVIRERKNIEEIAFHGKFGEPINFDDKEENLRKVG